MPQQRAIRSWHEGTRQPAKACAVLHLSPSQSAKAVSFIAIYYLNHRTIASIYVKKLITLGFEATFFMNKAMLDLNSYNTRDICLKIISKYKPFTKIYK